MDSMGLESIFVGGYIPVPWILWGCKTFMFDENLKIAKFLFPQHLSP